MVRDDLADVALADRVFAPHYATPIARIAARDAEVLLSGKTGADASGTISKGMMIEVFDISGGWAWIRSSSAIGYIPEDALQA